MDKRILWPVLVVLLVGLVAIFYPRKATEPPPEAVELPARVAPEIPDYVSPLGPEPDPEPAPDFVAQAPPEPLPPLPALEESDDPAQAALAAAAGETLVDEYLVESDVVRKLVATIDNLPRDTLWIEARAVPPIAERFLVRGAEGERVIAPANSARYAAFVLLADAVDSAALAAAYRRHYPLLQQAFEELGYTGRQFHNRLLEVIDHLLATPEIQGPIRVEQPHVRYRFADPELEALSSGQKILLRIGAENATILRAKLAELRTELEMLAAVPIEE